MQNTNIELINSDCYDAMRQMKPNSVDAIVTDPPYGLNFMGKDFDNPKMMAQASVMHGGLKRYPKGEKQTGYADCDMVKFQDYMTPIFEEALRVAKPGAHLLAFGGSRTYHRMACAIEDAGWEIRDCIMWVYGCLSEDSQILTKQGWKGIGEIKAGDAVVAFDKKRGDFKEEKATQTFLYDYDDTAYAIKSENTDQLISRNHRVLLDEGNGLEFKYAENLPRNAVVRIPVCKEKSGEVLTEIDLPELEDATVSEVHYKGRMWCVSVPSGAIVARRNGKVFVTGNSGFPKSMDVSKAIAKRAGGDLLAREAIDFMCARRMELGLSRIEFEKRIFGRSDGNVRNWEDGISLPNPGLWDKIKKAMELNETPYDAIMERGDKEVSRENGSFGYQKDGVRWTAEHVSHEATTDIAKKWNGYGTALKPAFEPVIVARKPLDGTVAANVLKWGTGALNIDGCRVATDERISCHGNSPAGTYRSAIVYGKYKADKPHQTEGQKLGRFPANLVHDGSNEVLACFPDTGKSSGGGKHTKGKGDNTVGYAFGEYSGGNSPDEVGFGDSGSAARFFYCAKASRKERGEGNTHPTLKPLALMRWLITLVAPPDAVVLDPFMGSGSTGVAALQLNRRFIGIEKEPEYFEIAKKRIGDWKGYSAENEPSSLHNSAPKPEPSTNGTLEQGSLF